MVLEQPTAAASLQYYLRVGLGHPVNTQDNPHGFCCDVGLDDAMPILRNGIAIPAPRPPSLGSGLEAVGADAALSERFSFSLGYLISLEFKQNMDRNLSFTVVKLLREG